MKLLSVFVVTALSVCAQKKPVTLEAMTAARGGFGGAANWAPDGKRFVYQERGKLFLYEAAARKATPILAMDALEKAATKVPEPESFDWQNRRVSEQRIQWFPDGRRLLALAGGDIFIINVGAGGMSQVTATPVDEADAKLSPDGTKVSYRVRHDLYVMDLANGKSVRLTRDGSGTVLNGELDWVYPEELSLGTAHWWSPDSKSIAYLQLDISKEMIHPHVDMLGVFARPEPQRYPKAGTPNPEVHVGVVAANGGATRWMDMGGARDQLIARVNWLPDSSAVAVQRLNRVQTRLDLVVAAAGTGESRVLLSESDPAWINVDDQMHFLPNHKQLLWSSERSGFRHLYLYGLDGRQVAQLTSGEWEVSNVNAVDEADERIFFTSTEQSPLERHLYSVKFGGGPRTKLTQGAGTHMVSVSPTAEFFTDSYSSVTEPVRRTLHTSDGKEIAVLQTADRKPLEEYNILPTELVNFKGPDGTLFYGRLIKPANFEAGKKYPVVVMVYGGPHAQTVRNSWAGLSFDQVLAHRGFVIWQMDNRGSAGRGHKWESVVNRHLGKQELADQKTGIQYLVSLGFADPARIGIHGWSYGGYMTLNAMLHAPEVFSCGISGAPVTDWRHYDTIYTERYMGLPAENEKGYHDSSPVHFAANLKGKLMLLHNYGDDNVLYQNNMQMQFALQRAGKYYDLLAYPQKSHGVTGPANRHMRQAMITFFEQNLKP